jgi:phage terminase small subunit
MARNLSPKQRRFVNEFAKSRNAGESAVKAGYSKLWAANEAQRLQKKAVIRQAIREQIYSLERSTAITVERVMREVGLLAFSSLESYFDFDFDGLPIPKPSKSIDKEAIRALKSVKITEKTTKSGRGEDAEEETTRVIEYTLWDKGAAIERLAKHFGMFLEAEQVREMHKELTDILAAARAATAKVDQAEPS